MDDYYILDGSTPYQAIILSLSSESLSDNFTNITKELKLRNIKGNILLDYYGYTQDNKNRFFEMFFDENNFIFSSFKKATVDKNTKYLINSFFEHESEKYKNMKI